MTILCEIKPGTVVGVHNKCGSQSVRNHCDAHGIEYPLSIGTVQKLQPTRVVLVLRHPMLRLLSAYRMFYPRTIVAWQNYHDHTVQRSDILKYARRNWRSIMEDPVRAWCAWLDSEHLQCLVTGTNKEMHVDGYSKHYRNLEKQLPNVEYAQGLTEMQQRLRIPIRHDHVGPWHWPSLTAEDFVSAAGRVPHLDADFELWNAYK